MAELKLTASESLKLASKPVIRDLVFDRVMIGPFVSFLKWWKTAWLTRCVIDYCFSVIQWKISLNHKGLQVVNWCITTLIDKVLNMWTYESRIWYCICLQFQMNTLLFCETLYIFYFNCELCPVVHLNINSIDIIYYKRWVVT